MSPEWKKTLAFVAAAVVLTTTAVLSRTLSSRERSSDFAQQGKVFFPAFKDPFACTSLEVVDVDPETATAQAFKVMQKDGKWVIPSHHDYPADAKDRLAKTAGGVIDLVRDKIASKEPADYDKLGVSDPLDPKSASSKGTGKRVTLKDTGGQVLADFIIGNEVGGNSKQRYVRVPSEKWTFAVNVTLDLSTKFSDWIETNLLKIDAGKIRKIAFDSRKIIPRGGKLSIQKGDVVSVERKDATGPWKMEGVPEGQEINTDQINQLVTALGDLKIVGVRTKPAGLTRDLKSRDGKITLSEDTLMSLAQRGFYMIDGGQLLSNQGDVRIECEDGAYYILRFGEVTFAKGEELSAGEDPKKKSANKKADDKKKDQNEGGVESRFLFVTASFDSDLLPPEKPKVEPPAALPDNPFLGEPADPKRIADEKKADELRLIAFNQRKKTIDEASKNVDERSDRFAPWYYVVPGDSFRNIVLDRTKLIRPKGQKPDAGMPPGLPNFGLPPGVNPVPDDLLNPR